MDTRISSFIALLRAAILPRTNLAMENAASRQQLTIYQRAQNRVPLRAKDCVFWVVLRRLWFGWERARIVVRPAVSPAGEDCDHAEWGADEITGEFDAKFGIHHSASTIRRYMVPTCHPKQPAAAGPSGRTGGRGDGRKVAR